MAERRGRLGLAVPTGELSRPLPTVVSEQTAVSRDQKMRQE